MRAKSWFLIFVIFFPGLFFVGQFFILKFYFSYVVEEYSNAYDRACWVRGKPKVVIMGSSMARHGVIPEIIRERNGLLSDDVVNIAMNAATPFQNYIALKRQVTKFDEVSVFYYTLDPWMFNEKYYKHSVLERVMWSYRQYAKFSYENSSRNNYYLPLKLFVSSGFSGCGGRVENNGFFPLPAKALKTLADDFGDLYGQDDIYGISDFQLEMLRRIKMLVEANSSKLVFLLTPKHLDWITQYSQYKDYNSAFIDKLNAIIGDSIVIGSFDSKRYELTESDFMDHDHLSMSGAEKYTSMIFSDMSSHIDMRTRPFRRLESY